MASEIRTVGKHSLIYGVGIVIGKLASFLMLPIYTRYLTPVDYGILELLAMLIDVVGMIAGLGFVQGLYKFYAEAEDPSEQAAVMGTAMLGSVVLAGVGAAFGLAAASSLSRLVLGVHGSPVYVRLFFVVYLFQTAGMVPLALLRARNRSALFVAANTTKLLLSLGLNILFVVYLGMGVLGVMIGSVIAESAFAVYLTSYLIRTVGLHSSKRAFRQLLGFGAPMVFWSLGTFVLVFSDRFFLRYYAGTGQVGVYSLAYQFAFVLSALAFTPFMTVWEPRRFEVAKLADAQDIYSRMFVYLNVVVALAGAGIALFVHDLLRVMSSPGFWPAAGAVPLLLAAQIVFMWASFCNVGLFLTGRSKVMARVALGLTLATLALNFALIPFLGMWGAALATLAAYGLRFLLIYGASQRAYFIAYDWVRVRRLYALVLGAVLVRVAAWSLPLPASIPLSVILLSLLTWATYVAVFQGWERDAMRTVLRDAWLRSYPRLAQAVGVRIADRL